VPSTIATVDDLAMERFAREDVLAVLARFGVSSAMRASPLDPTEEVFLLSREDFQSVDVRDLTLALMAALPHTKVWVAEAGPRWSGEPI
jgi:hypothetical protein